MKITKKELEDRLMEGLRNGSITASQADAERKQFEKPGVLPILTVLEEGENSEIFPTREKHQVKTSYKWAIEQVEELKPFGNFYKTYFNDKPTREC